MAISSSDVRSRSSDVAHGQSNAACGLADHRTVLQSLVNSFDAVLRHGQQKAAGKLVARGSSVEKSWRSVCEPALRHVVVGVHSSLDVLSVNANGNSHKHVLGSLSNLSIKLEQVGTLKRFEAKEIELEVTIVDNHGVEALWLVSNACKITRYLPPCAS